MHLILLLISSIVFAVDGGRLVHEGYFNHIIKVTSKSKFAHCTGTLLTPTIVVTAAHCVDQGPSKRKQSVSFAGDASGKVGFVFRSTIKVKEAFYNPTYFKLDKLIEAMKDSDLTKADGLEREQRFHDLAFLVLEKPQVIGAADLGRLGCKEISPLSPVLVVGYGRSVVNGEDLNRLFSLLGGENFTGKKHKYELFREFGSMVNSGDSGSPLLLKGDLHTVYAVASSKIGNRVQTFSSVFTPTASSEARELYRLIQTSSSAPEELKEITRVCLTELSDDEG